jgi:TRAP-type C4-dicarboxylate transport system permease small subunit
MKGDINMDNLLYSTSAFVRRINHAMVIIGNFFVLVLAIVVTLDVIMRYLLGAPLTGVKQMAEYALVWFCFLALGWVLIGRQHVSITLIETFFVGKSKSGKRRLSILIDLICLFYTIPLLCLSAKEVWVEYWQGAILTGEIGGIAAYLPHLCIPIGFLSVSIILVLNVVASILRIELPIGGSKV